jgi:hypothetical protein
MAFILVQISPDPPHELSDTVVNLNGAWFCAVLYVAQARDRF